MSSNFKQLYFINSLKTITNYYAFFLDTAYIDVKSVDVACCWVIYFEQQYDGGVSFINSFECITCTCKVVPTIALSMRTFET